MAEIKRYLAGEVPILKKDTSVAEQNISKSKVTIKKIAIRPKRKKVTIDKIKNSDINKKIKKQKRSPEEMGARLCELNKELEAKKPINQNKTKIQNDKARENINKSFEKRKKTPPRRKVTSDNIDNNLDSIKQKKKSPRRKKRTVVTYSTNIENTKLKKDRGKKSISDRTAKIRGKSNTSKSNVYTKFGIDRGSGKIANKVNGNNKQNTKRGRR